MVKTEEFNPYAAPKTADLFVPATDEISYDGESLRIPKEFTFPPVCLKTGAVDDLSAPMRRKVSWYPPLLALLIILNLLIFIIVAACVSKKGVIHFQLSKAVARKRHGVILRNWGVFALSIVLLTLGISYKSGGVAAAGGLTLLGAIILSVVASRFLYPKRIDKTHVYLKGVPDEVARALVASYSRG